MFADCVATELGMDEYFANTLEVSDGVLTGVAIPPIVNAEYKEAKLREIADSMGITLRQTLAKVWRRVMPIESAISRNFASLYSALTIGGIATPVNTPSDTSSVLAKYSSIPSSVATQSANKLKLQFVC